MTPLDRLQHDSLLRGLVTGTTRTSFSLEKMPLSEAHTEPSEVQPLEALPHMARARGLGLEPIRPLELRCALPAAGTHARQTHVM